MAPCIQYNSRSNCQVRFVDITTGNVIDLIDVPRLAFTEVMRYVDLFVGVGNEAKV